MKRYYSPQLDRDLISELYQQAKARHMPMTKLASQLIRAALCSQEAERDHTKRRCRRGLRARQS